MKPTARRNDLDWLRVIAILSVFLYHSAHFFDGADWSVKNPTTYAWVSWLMAFFEGWGMPLIFLISGASVFFTIRKGSPGRFLRDKLLRLLAPLPLGIFVFGALQVYLERLTHGQFQGSFIAFLPHYFEGLHLGPNTGNFAWHGMHLWYL